MSATSNSQSEPLIRLTKVVAKFVAINAARVLLILMFNLLKLTIRASEFGIGVLASLAPKINVLVAIDEASDGEFSTDPKFTEDEIEVMAENLPKNISTIQEIAEHYEVSTRQARKVKSASKRSVNVNQYSIA